MATQNKSDKANRAGIQAQSTSHARDLRGKRQTNHRIRQAGQREIRAEVDATYDLEHEEWRAAIGLDPH